MSAKSKTKKGKKDKEAYYEESEKLLTKTSQATSQHTSQNIMGKSETFTANSGN